MGKRCAADNCDSGQYRHRKRRKDLGLSPLSIFRVPQCPNKRRMWSEGIGRELGDKDYLCELHFNDADIRRTNGSSGFKAWVRKDAIPIAINNNDEKKINKPKIVTAMDVALPAAEEPVENVELPVAVQDNIFTESEYRGPAEDLILRDPEGASVNDEVPEDIEAPVVPGAEMFTVYDIVEHFYSHPLRQTWCWMMNPRQADSIVFTQLDPATGNIRLHLDVESDLSLKVRTPDEKVTQDIQLSVHSVQDIEEVLERLEITPMCCGSGFEADSRSEHCPGIVNVDDYSRNMREKRCPDCRELRKALQDRHNSKKKESLIDRYERAKYFRHLEQQQKRRLQIKVDQLKEQVRALKARCVAVKQQTLVTVITELSPSQPEAVKACSIGTLED